MKIEIKILNEEFYSPGDLSTAVCTTEDLLPCYATPGSAALDLICTEDITIYPGEVKAIHTGLAIWIGSADKNNTLPLIVDHNGKNTGYHYRQDFRVTGLVLPRSGLGTKGLGLANTIGLIDEDYQGELIVQACNRNNDIIGDRTTALCFNQIPIELKAGDRFAQLMFIPIIKAKWDIVEKFSNETERNTGGFGSSGK